MYGGCLLCSLYPLLILLTNLHNYADYTFDVKEPEFTALSKKAKGKIVWNNNSWLLIFDKLFYFIECMSFSINPEKEVSNTMYFEGNPRNYTARVRCN